MEKYELTHVPTHVRLQLAVKVQQSVWKATYDLRLQPILLRQSLPCSVVVLLLDLDVQHRHLVSFHMDSSRMCTDVKNINMQNSHMLHNQKPR